MRGILGALAMFSGLDMETPLFLADVQHGARYSRKRERYTTLHEQHGKRELSRRQRQIAAGRLRVENGLAA